MYGIGDKLSVHVWKGRQIQEVGRHEAATYVLPVAANMNTRCQTVGMFQQSALPSSRPAARRLSSTARARWSGRSVTSPTGSPVAGEEAGWSCFCWQRNHAAQWEEMAGRPGHLAGSWLCGKGSGNTCKAPC